MSALPKHRADKSSSDSHRRIARTTYQVVVALLSGVPLILLSLPVDVQASAVAVGTGLWIGVVATAINKLEDAGLIPAWLK